MIGVLRKKPKSIRARSKRTVTIELSKAEESRAMQAMTNINDTPIKTTINTTLNICKGLVYIYNYNLVDFPEFRKGMMEQHGLQDLTEPQWIKPNRKNQAKPLLLSFRDEMPLFIGIPGENMRSVRVQAETTVVQ